MLPGLTKAGCLKAFSSLLSHRAWAPATVAGALSKVRLLPFVLQAGQAVQSLTGYGLVLGSIMGGVTDLGWGVVQLARGKSLKISGPPPSDIVGKAVRYLQQGAYHMFHGQMFSFEEHLLLAAADVVATQVVAASEAVSGKEYRVDAVYNTPAIQFEPWTDETRAGLDAIGIDYTAEQVEPFPDAPAGATYGDLIQIGASGVEAWWQAVAVEFPKNQAATLCAYLQSEAGRDVLDWLNGVPGSVHPVYSPQEYAFARMFEAGVFPWAAPVPQMVTDFADRAVELAGAGGNKIPGRAEIITALDETMGGHVAR